MPKKKVTKKKDSKKKGGKKKGSKKKRTKSGKQKPKKPTLKDKLNAEIEELTKEFHVVDSKLKQQEKILKSLKDQRNRELKSKEACVNHLERVLMVKTDECQELQKEFQFIKDMEELTENRASDLYQNIEKNRDISKCLFLQEKSELEGKLSAFEEKILQKNAQLSHLERLEKELAEKIAIKRKDEREENRNRINQIVEKRAEFEKMVDDLCAEYAESFEANLPVYTKQYLSDNICLRNYCETAAENLLKDHDRKRNLSNLEKSLKIENDTQSHTEASMESLERKLKNRQGTLLEGVEQLETDVSDYTGVGDDEDLAIKQLAIDVRKGMLCKVEDHLADLLKIEEDQEEYMLLLQKEVETAIDRNGSMMSTLLRSAQIVRSRMKERYRRDETYVDFELLQQIRMLLEDYLIVD